MDDAMQLLFYRANPHDPFNPQVCCPVCDEVTAYQLACKTDVYKATCPHCKEDLDTSFVQETIASPQALAFNTQLIYQLQTALALFELMGDKLIGRTVHTSPMGTYPGGDAVIERLYPDPAATEIVFQVSHPTFGSIGVFFHELVRLK